MGAEAEWYCHDCETYGGGPPNHMSMEEHINFAHNGYMAEMEEI